MKNNRIASLSEVALRVKQGHEFGYCLCDFLDGFYLHPMLPALQEEPPKISSYYDAYLAAVSDYFCREHGWILPQWCSDQNRFLKEPANVGGSHALRMLYLMDSPASFRERNIFVSNNALSRA